MGEEEGGDKERTGTSCAHDAFCLLCEGIVAMAANCEHRMHFTLMHGAVRRGRAPPTRLVDPSELAEELAPGLLSQAPRNGPCAPGHGRRDAASAT